MEMSPAALERMKTQPITDKQAFAIKVTCSRLGLTFRGTTKYDAWEFLDKYYLRSKESVPKGKMYSYVTTPVDNEEAIRRYGRPLLGENTLSNDLLY